MTTGIKEFAPDWPRTPEGWVDFGRDIELRRSLFPPEAFEHPAKANLNLVRELAKYLTPPGGSVLDPFAGTGSQLISALDGYKVVAIELEPYFLEIMAKTVANWKKQDKDVADVFIYEGDCRQVLQKIDYLVNTAIFSPPYSTTMASTGIRETDAEVETGTGRYKTGEYTRSSLNLSRLNPFFYSQAMDQVLKRLYARIAPGGKICIISKDRIEGSRRIMLSDTAIQRAQRNGFKLDVWLKHRPPSTIAKASAAIALKKHGKVVKVVEDEDLLVFRKPE